MSLFLLYFIFLKDCHIYHFIKRLRSLRKREREPEWLTQASSAEQASARYRFHSLCLHLSMVAEMEHTQSALPSLYFYLTSTRRELIYIPHFFWCPFFSWALAAAGIYDGKPLERLGLHFVNCKVRMQWGCTVCPRRLWLLFRSNLGWTL